MSFPTAALNSACVSAFGETVTYTSLVDAEPVSITAIREDPAKLMDANPSEYIALWVDLETWTGSAPAKGDYITIGDSVWTLFEIRVDGEQGARLIFGRTVNATE